MTFARPEYLGLLLALVPIWLFLSRAGSRRSLVLKTAVYTALIIALADPWGMLTQKRLAVTVVMDMSASMPGAAARRAEALLRDLVKRRTGADLKLVTFAERARAEAVPADPSRIALGPPPGPRMATDVEQAIDVALSTFPRNGARRMVLITDGNENRGHALTAALLARQSDVQISAIAAGGGASLPLQVKSIAMPQTVFSSERFVVSLTITSARDVAGRMILTCQGREIGAAAVTLAAGDNQVDLDAKITGAGVSVLEARMSSGSEARVLFSQAVTVRRPRVLYVSGAGERPHSLSDTLRRSEMEVEPVSAFPPGVAPESWDAVVFDNFPDRKLTPAEDTSIEKYVSAGGGLIFIAGQNNARLPENPQDGFERLLPVRGDPGPAPDQPTAVVLVLDKSASMDGLKIAMVREAARQSLSSLRPIDKIGVITFDSSFRWVVPLGPASDMARINAAIATINADGGTSIYPALEAAYQAIRAENAARKHIILLTDGWSTPGEFAQLAAQAADAHVTISSIGVGKEVNHSLLESLAGNAHGKSYFVDTPETIPQIITGEVRQLAVSSIREGPFRVSRVRQVEFTDGVDFARAPRLLGYVKAKAREGSETILRTDSGEPLLVRWQFGLGRVVAFLSDAKNRWAAGWLRWNDYGKLWPQLIRDVCRRNRTVRAGVRPGNREGEAVVYYDLVPDSTGRAAAPFSAAEAPRVMVSVAGEPPRSVALEQTAPGHFEAPIPVDERGLYRIVSGSTEFMLPEAGFYRDSAELRDTGVNTPLLHEIVRLTGGRLDPGPGDLLSDSGTLVRERVPLWPYWLVVALLLNFVELAMRKGLLDRLRSLSFPRLRRTAPAPGSDRGGEPDAVRDVA